MHTQLRAERTARGLNQHALARLLGTSQPAVVAYERGKHRPIKRDIAERLVAIFGMPIDALLAPEKESDAAREDDAAITDSPEKEGNRNDYR